MIVILIIKTDAIFYSALQCASIYLIKFKYIYDLHIEHDFYYIKKFFL